ncbi:MAG: class I SAM-dependent methyltransferase [Chloroflexi bacterium]|nr:class I SAM-dependent methyltransferase [Chloroflexota bacterium]
MTIYAASVGPKYEQILSWIGSHKRVLDVGCGAGAFTARIAESNEVVGVESTEENWRLASEHATVLRGDFPDVDVQGPFDVVLFGDVLEHMYDPERALDRARELGDEVIVCVPNFDCVVAKGQRAVGIKQTETGILDKTHVYYFNRRIVEKMLREHGLEIIEFASPKPRRAPRWYQLLVNIRPEFFGIQLMYRCRVTR